MSPPDDNDNSNQRVLAGQDIIQQPPSKNDTKKILMTTRVSPPPPSAMTPRPWNLKDTPRMEELVAALIQMSRRGGNRSNIQISLNELEQMIGKIWPAVASSSCLLKKINNNHRHRLSVEAGPTVFHLVCCAAAAALATTSVDPKNSVQPLFLLTRENNTRSETTQTTNAVVQLQITGRDNFLDTKPLTHFMQAWNTLESVPLHLFNNLWKQVEECTADKKEPCSTGGEPKANVPPSSLWLLNNGAARNMMRTANKQEGGGRGHSSTVEERVRARAKAKQAQREKNDQEQQEAQIARKKCGTTEMPLLQSFAQILWSHARSIQERQKQMMPKLEARFRHLTLPSNEQQQKPMSGGMVTLTQQDVVGLLQTSIAVQTRPTKRQVLAAVHQLCQQAPEWLLMTPPNSFDPKATLWIFHKLNVRLDDEWLRSKFGAHKSAKSDTAQATPAKKRNLEASLRTDTDTVETLATSAAEPAKKRGVTTFLANAAANSTSLAAASTAKMAGKTSGKARPTNATVPKDKKAVSSRTRRMLEYDDNSGGKSTQEHQHEQPSDPPHETRAKASSPSKRKSPPKQSGEGQVASPPLPPKEKRPRKSQAVLRINHNFILSDADYAGGEQLLPGLYDSPRGLKGLFQLMKQGQRI